MADPPLLARRKNGPLVVFIHVPKAAGSTVNRHLARWSRDGLDHAERYRNRPQKLARIARRLDWISGHLALNRMLDLLAPLNRPLHIYGTIRQPLGHVAAQYNWQIEIFHRGPRVYNAHPPAIRSLSERIRANDNSNPQAVIDILRSRGGLFLNLQSRFLLGDDITPDHTMSPGSERLAAYRKIALPWEIDDMLHDITGQHPTPQQENISHRHFDRTVFHTEDLTNFLLRNNRFDHKLFWYLKAKATEAEN